MISHVFVLFYPQLEPSLTPANLQEIYAGSAQLQQSILPMIAFLQLRSERVPHAGQQSTSQQQLPALTDEQSSIDLLSQLTHTLSQLSLMHQMSAGNGANGSSMGDTRRTATEGLGYALIQSGLGQPQTAAVVAGRQEQGDGRLAARDIALGMLRQQNLLQRLLTHLLPLMTRDGQRLSQADAELSTLNAHVAALGDAREQMMGQLNVSLPGLVQRCEVLTAENAVLRSDGKTLKLRVKEKLGLVAGHNLVLRNQITAQQVCFGMFAV